MGGPVLSPGKFIPGRCGSPPSAWAPFQLGPFSHHPKEAGPPLPGTHFPSEEAGGAHHYICSARNLKDIQSGFAVLDISGLADAGRPAPGGGGRKEDFMRDFIIWSDDGQHFVTLNQLIWLWEDGYYSCPPASLAVALSVPLDDAVFIAAQLRALPRYFRAALRR